MTFIVACFAFIVDFPEQVFVVRELFLVHASHLSFVGLLVHLAAKEVLVVLIDTGNFVVKALLLELVVLLVRLPDDGLLVVERLFDLLASLLLRHLAVEQLAHLILFLTVAFHAAFVFHTSAHLFLLIEAHKGLLFVTDAVLLL